MKPRVESLLAWAAAAVGVIGIASALTPELADDSDLVRGLLPPGVPTLARVATLSFGIALIWLSRSLARRRRRAWQLAVAIVLASAITHLAKGFDVEEAGASLVVLAALLYWRRRFDVPGDPATLRPLAATFALLLAVGGWALFFGERFPDRWEHLLAGASIVLGFRALYLWLRPLRLLVRQSVEERRAARTLVEAYGRDSLAFFALRRDKSYFFSPNRRAFLAYRVLAGTALVSGDPIGDECEFDSLFSEFRRVASACGWRIAVLGASGEQLHRYRRLGLRAVKIGDEAILEPTGFSLEGRPIRKVRQSVNRLAKAGYAVRVVASEDADADLRAEIDDVSRAWLGRQPERGFSMALDELYLPGTQLVVVEEEGGAVGGFLHLAPSPAARGYSLSAMRRRPETPNGLMEFAIAETIEWARENEITELSLNFCVFTDLLARDACGWRRIARHGLLAFDRLFQLERLYAFNRKFFPTWRARYICVERLGDLPFVGLAYLRVEQLLVPPGPWVRSRRSRVLVQH